MTRRSAALLLAALLCGACSGGTDEAGPSTSPSATPSPSTSATASPTSSLSVVPTPTATAVTPSVVADGFEVPWGLAFLPNGDALVSERGSGDVYRVTPRGAKTKVAHVDAARPRGEGGLLGLAVSSRYATDQWVYAYLTTESDNRLVRFRLGSAAQPQVLLSGIPAEDYHDAGRIAFGPDGFLYVATGDAGQPERAQDTDYLGGKVLRLTADGKPAPGNPFGNEVWTRGHRDPQGLTFDEQGRVWSAEFGEHSYDELNLIRKGGNYGWPDVEGPGTGGGRFVSPVAAFAPEIASPSGVAYAGGRFYIAALRGTRLITVPVTGTTAGKREDRYVGTYGRLRTVAVEPGGGALWVTTSNCDGRGTCGARKDQVLRLPL